MESNGKIEIVRGNTYTRTAYFKYKSTGSKLVLTGKTVRFMVKEKLDDTDLNSLISKTITTFYNTDTEFIIDLTSEDTDLIPKNYYYELRVDESGNRKTTQILNTFKITNNLIKS